MSKIVHPAKYETEELNKEFFNALIKALDSEKPITCEFCGEELTEDNFGFIHSEVKSCKELFCLIHALDKAEESKVG